MAGGIPRSITFIAQDGHTIKLDTQRGNPGVLNWEGTGMPPIEYITERGPFQHGETIKDYFLRPRIVQYLIRRKFCSRQAYFDGRNALLDALRPNRGVNGVIRHVLPDGQKRDLTVAVIEGPKFEADKLDEWDQWAYQEVIRFIANNPVYFNPTQRIKSYGPLASSGFPYTFPFLFSTPSELEFPIEFPIEFQPFDLTLDVENAGTWIEYPVIEVFGPAKQIIITNHTTGESLALFNYDILVGQSVIFNLAYGVKTVKLSDGTNLIGYLSTDSDLATFHLDPGENSVEIDIGSYGAATYAEIRHYDRYIGF